MNMKYINHIRYSINITSEEKNNKCQIYVNCELLQTDKTLKTHKIAWTAYILHIYWIISNQIWTIFTVLEA
jgi:hypothetical protein